MSTKDNGGPAFPTMHDERRAYSFGTEEGMTLRDYFAIHADISKDIEADGCISQRLATNLMDGTVPPNWEGDFLAARAWWLEAEMRFRYMKADAMIAARDA